MKRVVTLAVVGTVTALIACTAQAQFKGVGKYQSSIIENNFPFNSTDFSFTAEKSKISIKPSGKAGDGGLVTQLNMKFVDCAGDATGNDSGAGTCGPKGALAPNGVMVLSVIALGADLSEVAGVRFYLEKGKSRFVETGKNKQGSTSFGSLISVLFQRPLGIGAIKIKTDGSDPENPTTGCGQPLEAGNTCADGALWAFAGVRLGEDPDVTCVDTDECDAGGSSPTLICVSGLCEPEPCTMDSDCDQNGAGSGGTMECGSNGTCCNPVTDGTCAGQVP